METDQSPGFLFANYVLSSGKLREFQQLASELDEQLQDSHTFLQEIKTKWGIINSNNTGDVQPYEIDDVSRHGDISRFLEAGPPKLLLPDMEDFYNRDLDVQKMVEKFGNVLESLNKKINLQKTFLSKPAPTTLSAVDVESFAVCLHQFSERMAKLRTLKCDSKMTRNPELEGKLEKLCEDVNLLTKVIQSNTSISECNEKWAQNFVQFKDFNYTDTFKELLDAVNEITFMFLEARK